MFKCASHEIKVEFYCRVDFYLRETCVNKKYVIDFHFYIKQEYIACIFTASPSSAAIHVVILLWNNTTGNSKRPLRKYIWDSQVLGKDSILRIQNYQSMYMYTVD